MGRCATGLMVIESRWRDDEASALRNESMNKS